MFTHLGLEGKTFGGDEDEWSRLSGEWGFPLWGGGKTWVAPQSSWPHGAPHRDLDSLAWTVTKTWCDAESLGVIFVSPVCSLSGLQITRTLRWPVNSVEWTVTHSLLNAGQICMTCGVWDVLMLSRPARVDAPLPAGFPGAVTALPENPSLESLVSDGILDLGPAQASVYCETAKEFKCGFQSTNGEVVAVFADWQLAYRRRSDVDSTRAYAHGHPLEIFNAPVLPYFEIETHSPMQTLAPGDRIDYQIHERVEPLVPVYLSQNQ